MRNDLYIQYRCSGPKWNHKTHQKNPLRQHTTISNLPKQPVWEGGWVQGIIRVCLNYEDGKSTQHLFKHKLLGVSQVYTMVHGTSYYATFAYITRNECFITSRKYWLNVLTQHTTFLSSDTLESSEKSQLSHPLFSCEIYSQRLRNINTVPHKLYVCIEMEMSPYSWSRKWTKIQCTVRIIILT